MVAKLSQIGSQFYKTKLRCVGLNYILSPSFSIWCEFSITAMAIEFIFPGKETCKLWVSDRLVPSHIPHRYRGCCIMPFLQHEAGCFIRLGEMFPHWDRKFATLEFNVLRYRSCWKGRKKRKREKDQFEEIKMFYMIYSLTLRWCCQCIWGKSRCFWMDQGFYFPLSEG